MKALPKVLLVEDDNYISGALALTLKSTYIIDVACTGKSALYKSDTDNYDIVILDLNLPDISGLAVCQQLRDRGVQAPIFILSGEANVLTKIQLLEAGANDYLTKPFVLGELQARLKVLTRVNPKNMWPKTKLEAYGVELNRRTFTAIRNGISINFRRKEFEILDCLMENAGNLVARKEILDRVWKFSDELWTNTLDVHMKGLRDKIDRPFDISLIQTIYGRGYKFEQQLSELHKIESTKT